MHPSDLDPYCCPCGKAYSAGGFEFNGASFGSRAVEWYKCRSCGTPIVFVSDAMAVAVTTAKVAAEFPEEGVAYVNGPLDVTVRAHRAAAHAARESAERAAWEFTCTMMGLPAGVKFDRRPEDTRPRLVMPDGAEIEQGLEKATLLTIARDSAHFAANGAFIWPPAPPRLPECLVAYVHRPDGAGRLRWQLATRSESAMLVIPPDPRRVAHDEYFGEIFKRLAAAGAEVSSKEEVPNRYWGDEHKSEPWYEFWIGSRKYVVGPRKRVISIEVEEKAPESFMHVTSLRELAKRDGVTYEDGGREDALASKVLIHAWGADKCVEYILAIREAGGRWI